MNDPHRIPWYQRGDDRGNLPSALSYRSEKPSTPTIEDLVHESGNEYINSLLAEIEDIKEYIAALAQLWIEADCTDIRGIITLKDRLTSAIAALNTAIAHVYNTYDSWKANQVEEGQNYFEQLRKYRRVNRIQET